MTRIAIRPKTHQAQSNRLWHTTSMTESRAWKLLGTERNAQAVEFLMGQYDPSIHAEVRRLRLVLGSDEYEDAAAEGRVSLFNSIGMFDASKGVKFITFLMNVLRWDLVRHSRNSRPSRSYRGEKGKVFAATMRLKAMGNYSPSDEELAKEAKLSLLSLRNVRLSVLDMRSFADFEYGEGGEDIEDKAMTPIAGEVSLDFSDPCDVLTAPHGDIDMDRHGRGVYDLVASLPPLQRVVVEGKLYGEKTFAQIGLEEGVTGNTVRLWYFRGIKAMQAMAEPCMSTGRVMAHVAKPGNGRRPGAYQVVGGKT